jgi:hypothetical protein
VNFAKGIGETVLHPINTITGVGKLGAGTISALADKALPERDSGIPGFQPQQRPYSDVAQAFWDMLGDRYGGADKAFQTLYEDPVGVLADLSTVFGGASGLLKGASAVTKAAGAAKTAQGFAKAGNAASVAGRMSDPLLLSTKAATGALSSAAKKMQLAERLYQSGLKPSLSGSNIPNIQQQVATGLREGITISESGAKKLQKTLAELEAPKRELIDSAAARGETINPADVAQRTDATTKRFGNQVNPSSDLADIASVRDEFLDTNKTPIPVDKAQEMKSGTYGKLKNHYERQNSSAARVEAQKAIARGIKEELELVIPELKEINARESLLLNLEPVLEYAVERNRNRQILGPASALSGIGAGLATGDIKTGLIVAGVQAALTDPAVRSRLAFAINRVQSRLPQKYGKARMTTIFNRLNMYRDFLNDSIEEQSNDN